MRFDAPTPDEFPLIYDAWAQSFRKSPWAGCVPNHLWDQVSRACASEILSRGARVIVAVQDLEDGTRRVLGYSVSEPDIRTLHWLFVKRDYRRTVGVGRALLAETVKDWDASKRWTYTHRTASAPRFLGTSFSWDPVPARVKR